MYCKNCGAEIDDQAAICPKCGFDQSPPVVDNGGFGWGLLGCCVPIAGLILFLLWKDTKPKTAKAAGIGALISAICLALYYVLIMVVGVGAAFMA